MWIPQDIDTCITCEWHANADDEIKENKKMIRMRVKNENESEDKNEKE
jgi:hypothetical protein